MLDELSFMDWLKNECGYSHVRPLPGKRWAATSRLMYTTAIVTGTIGDKINVADRWCYSNPNVATAALEAWDGAGEPQGWHRHPATGRRRNENGSEWVNL
jgi:hypothetical protein